MPLMAHLQMHNSKKQKKKAGGGRFTTKNTNDILFQEKVSQLLPSSDVSLYKTNRQTLPTAIALSQIRNIFLERKGVVAVGWRAVLNR